MESAIEKNNSRINTRRDETRRDELEINRLFNSIYGIDEIGEISIDLMSPDSVRDIKQLVSFSVGCMFGRFTLEKPGISFAGGEFVHNASLFLADFDNIIPINDNEYFGDDIVTRFVEFTRVAFGDENLEENLFSPFICLYEDDLRFIHHYFAEQK